MQDIEYNGMTGSSIAVYAKDLISLPAASANMTEIKLSGRDGTLYKWDGTYEANEIKIEFNYIGPVERWHDRWRMAQIWLSAHNSTLKISDDADFFYKITHVTLDECSRTTQRIGNFTANFKPLDGLQYLVDGTREYDIKDIVEKGLFFIENYEYD